MAFNFSQYSYSPCFKTKDGEIKAYEFVDSALKDKILPLVELTRGRKSKYEKVGFIQKRIDKFSDMFGNNYFILDITSQEKQMNAELENLLGISNGFQNWCDFLINQIKPDYNVVPVAHISDDFTIWSDIQRQITTLLNNFDCIAIRLFVKDMQVLQIIQRVLKDFSDRVNQIIIIFDYEYIQYGRVIGYINKTILIIQQAVKMGFNKLIITSSSYPKNIADMCNNPDYGILTKEEPLLYRQITPHLQNNAIAICGDYSSIHPIVQDDIYNAPIPKIEFGSKTEYIYYRGKYNNTSMAYHSIANQAVLDKNFHKVVSCWGKDMIIDASKNNIFARNATNWIAVRMNIHITTMV